MKKHILMVTSTVPRGAGDPEPRFVLDLARTLQGVYKVTVLAPGAPGALPEEELEGVRVLRYRYAPLRRWELLAYPGAIMPRLHQHAVYWFLVPLLFLGLHRSLRRLLKREQIDCAHAHWFVPQGVVQAFGFFGADPPPFVVTSHGGDISTLRGRLFDWLFQRVASRAAAVTVVSRQLSQELRRFVPDGRTVRVIPMGVDCERFSPQHRDEDVYRELHGRGPVILFVGRLAEKKGVAHLLRAASLAPLSACEGRLAIIGDGPEKAGLQALVEELGLGARVSFIPPVGHDQLPGLFASADILCAPSVVASDGDIDGMPTVILEGTASGLPCVTTPVGGIGDFIRDGENGMLVAPGDEQALSDALASLLADPKARHHMAERARSRALECDWHHIAAEFSEVYQEAINA